MRKRSLALSKNLVLCLCLVAINGFGQPPSSPERYSRQDTLRGSITEERAWWDVLKYRLFIQPDFARKFIKGEVTITYHVIKQSGAAQLMQIDLQPPMKIDKVYLSSKTNTPTTNSLAFRRDGNVYYVEVPTRNKTIDSIRIQFSGNPVIAINPPWDGGWIFTKDKKGRPWLTVACQGLGASSWYPCKDYQGDEPDQGAIIEIKVPNELVAVSNGRLYSRKKTASHTTWSWEVKNPINNYSIVPYIGKYVKWSDQYKGENRKTLTLDYWVLDYNLVKAKKQFGRDVKPMLRVFEHWFGPYPFLEDGYKLVETPHLGMEHQSGIAYGNQYMNGYLGTDISESGWGNSWDYIIIHESGHEWFANNITTKDIADMWVHEGFTVYSEVLFVETYFGKTAADEYCQGLRKRIENDRPVIGPYGVNKEGSVDMYYKGANLVHTIRQFLKDDMFRELLRGLNKDYWHKTVTSKEIESYISKKAGIDFSRVFDQYLRTPMIPVLEYILAPGKNPDNSTLRYRWANVVENFDMPVRILLDGKERWLKPKTDFRELTIEGPFPKTLSADQNFYITIRNAGQGI